MVFVGQCEALVCLGFVEIISFLYFSLGREAHRSENGGVKFFKNVDFFFDNHLTCP